MTRDEILTLRAEAQRLRAALERIVAVYEECDCTAKDLYLIAVNEVGSKQPKVENEVHEAPSTVTESTGQKDADDLIGDRIDERCPKCGADLLANKVGDKWCSLVGCDYSINDH